VTQLDPGFSESLGVGSGVLVVRVPRETPAARAGLQAADVILRANGTAVETVEALRRAIMRTPRGQTTKLEVMRRKNVTTVELGRD
jgi:serine protease Do